MYPLLIPIIMGWSPPFPLPFPLLIPPFLFPLLKASHDLGLTLVLGFGRENKLDRTSHEVLGKALNDPNQHSNMLAIIKNTNKNQSLYFISFAFMASDRW